MNTTAQQITVTDTDSEALRAFDSAVRAFNIYHGDPVALADQALAVDPSFTMAHLFKAYLFALATEPEAAKEARVIVDRARTLSYGDLEASHIGVLNRLLDGNWNKAAVAMDMHNMQYPRDLLGLQVGHLMDFYRGNARNLRDRIARALPHWSPDVPGYPVLLGMYAFGLEETGNYAKAEDTGRQAIELEPLDCWAHHAVAHVMEMQGRAQDGIGWMTSREPYWSGDDNFFKVHNWWHLALCHLDLGEIQEVLRLYDGPIRGDRSQMALDMLDASALLWRLQVTGHEVGDRWTELADCWDQHADGQLYPFNDWHAVMAYLGSGRDDAVQRVSESLRENAERNTENAGWAITIALPLVDGFTAFSRGNYQRAVELLHDVRYRANQFGGSHAQRDVIDWTLTQAALKSGLKDVAMDLAAERLALKPHSPVNQMFLDRARGLQ